LKKQIMIWFVLWNIFLGGNSEGLFYLSKLIRNKGTSCTCLENWILVYSSWRK
jgi:hypothetical protein